MDHDHVILGVHITDRMKNAVEVQKVFSEYGCHIKTRVGLHDVSDRVCEPSGIVLLEFLGSREQAAEMAARLCAIEGVQVQTMVFSH